MTRSVSVGTSVIMTFLCIAMAAVDGKAAVKAKGDRFVAYDDGTVLDTRTNLMWASKDNGEAVNWQDAKKYCENYRGGGYADWRLPTQDELAGLYDGSLKGSDLYQLTALIALTSCCPWASETSRSGAAVYASFFSFYSGKRLKGSPFHGTSGNRALPVRSVK